MKEKPKIEIRTGSDSDMPRISEAYNVLDILDIPYSSRILSAHRTPKKMMDEASRLFEEGFRVSIAAAGGSAHLPGMTASETLLPVVGLPVKTSALNGKDSFYSIIQMPDGIPVGCVGAGQSESAAILAAQIAYLDDIDTRNKIRDYRGLESIDSRIDNKDLVGIIKPDSIGLSNGVYNDFLDFLRSFGIGVNDYSVSVTDSKKLKDISSHLEEGGKAIIAIGELNDEDTTNYFPKYVSERTDIPVIGLPLAEGYAGYNDFIGGDIFDDMLVSKYLEENEKGSPVAGMGINRFKNAALYAAQICGLYSQSIQEKIAQYRIKLSDEVVQKDSILQETGVKEYLKRMT